MKLQDLDEDARLWLYRLIGTSKVKLSGSNPDLKEVFVKIGDRLLDQQHTLTEIQELLRRLGDV